MPVHQWINQVISKLRENTSKKAKTINLSPEKTVIVRIPAVNNTAFVRHNLIPTPRLKGFLRH